MSAEQETADRDEDDRIADPIDDLIVAGYCSSPQSATDATLDLADAESWLSAEDRKALDASGPNAVQRAMKRFQELASEEAKVWPQPAPSCETRFTQHSTVGHRSAESEAELKVLGEHYEKIMADQSFRWSGKYRLESKLGEGGQGVVYLTKCHGADDFEYPLALKLYAPDRFPTVAQYEMAMRRNAHVASTVAGIHHANVLDVQRFEEQAGIRMMLMEWIDGYDLRQLMVPAMLTRLWHRASERRWHELTENVVRAGALQPRLRPGVAVAIVRACLASLAELHSHDIVHGDIKLSNIMLKRNGHVKIIDIGSAFEWKNPPEMFHYTPRYAAPEVLEHRRYTPRSDLASLGYVLIELIAGRRLFDNANDEAALEEKKTLPKYFRDLLPERVKKSKVLVELCRRLIEPNPDRRFADAMAADLHAKYGATAFLNELVKGDLAAAYEHEIRLWLDVLD